jgi:hypothetical protein
LIEFTRSSRASWTIAIVVVPSIVLANVLKANARDTPMRIVVVEAAAEEDITTTETVAVVSVVAVVVEEMASVVVLDLPVDGNAARNNKRKHKPTSRPNENFL